MINISRFCLWLSATFAISNCQLLPLASYRHDIAFPSITGEFRAATINDPQPVRQFSAGMYFNPPPSPLQLLQSFPINPQVLSAAKDTFKSGNLISRIRFFGPPLKNLFTPNTSKERPESEGQEEEYRKYLKEEAEELEKEKHENDITTNLDEFSIESTSLQPNQNTFVRVNIQGKDYSYST